MAITSIIITMLAASAASSTPTAAAPAAPATQAAPAAKAQDKVVCQASQVTGSLVRKRKACQTKGTWAKQSESHQNQWKELQGTFGSTNGN